MTSLLNINEYYKKGVGYMPDKATREIRDKIIDKLSRSIADDTGNMHEDELEQISADFTKTLTDALKAFNSSTFDDDGFIKRLRELDITGDKDREMVKNVLNSIATEYISPETLNQTEILLRRDINNICIQMPEMHDVIYTVRDAIIECNVATGEVSRAILFENYNDNEARETQVKEVETRHNLLMAIKNFIVPNTLRIGELYIQVVPFAKLFAEIEALKDVRNPGQKNLNSHFKESIPQRLYDSFSEGVDLYSDANLKAIMESVSPGTKLTTTNEYNIDQNQRGNKITSTSDYVLKEEVSSLLHNIQVFNGSSPIAAEYGLEAMQEFVLLEYAKSQMYEKKRLGSGEPDPASHFNEAINFNTIKDDGLFGAIDQEDIDMRSYKEVKGCYIKYLDSLRVVPIRMDRRVIGYYYVTTTIDLQNGSPNPNGVVDLSYQHYTRDKNMVERLANMIIRSFDKKMLERNIQLKNEIAEIIMAHRFQEGKLSFIYIPENEVIRLIINEDENGKGHSILEPSIFPARQYLLLNMYNMLYTLNNTTTRVHYVKSSGLNKDYAAQVQRTMRKFQQRRITIDDIHSYSGAINKIGGMGEMVLPAGRNDYKALETDTIEAAQNPISIEFLEQQRRQAISGTGAPHLLIINAIDEVDFAKTLELANARFLSTVSSYKIDFNKGLTLLYQRLLKYSTDLEDDEIQSFKFKFNASKQQELQITADMVQNFNNIVDIVMAAYYSKSEMEDENGNPTFRQKHLRRKLAIKYLPQLDFDDLDQIVAEVEAEAMKDETAEKVKDVEIENEDLKQIGAGEEEEEPQQPQQTGF